MTFNDTQLVLGGGKPFGYLSIFYRLVFVLLLRAGYLLVQLGSIPTENVYIILLQNVVDMSLGIFVYGLLGYTLAYGPDSIIGVIGWGVYIGSSTVDYDEVIFGLCAVLIGTAIITNFTAGRVHFIGYVLTTILYAGFLMPVFIHCVWFKDGIFNNNTFFKYHVSAKDYAGSVVIHLSAGISGLLAALFLGRRILRLYDIDESSIGTESPGTTIVGYIFIMIGMIGFSLPTPSYEQHHKKYYFAGVVVINNILAISSSMLVVITLSFVFFRKAFHYWVIQRCVQASLAGLVSVSAGVDVLSPLLSIGIAATGGALFTLISWLLNLTFIEDYCNVVSTHIICALFSNIMVALLGRTENLGYSVRPLTMLIHLFWQLVTAAAIFIATFVIMNLLYGLLYATGFLRNRNERINHKRAVNLLHRRDNVGIIERLYRVNRETSYLEPGPYGKSPEDGNSAPSNRNGNIMIN